MDVERFGWRATGLRVSRFARNLLGSAQAANDAPLSRSLAEDLRWYCRFWRARRTSIPWRGPTRAETIWGDEHPDLERFADMTVAVADFAGLRWVVRERIWHGFPDLPRYILFALDGEAVRLAWDFHRWPAAWREPRKADRRSDAA